MVRWVAIWAVVLAAIPAVAGAETAPGRVVWPVGVPVVSHIEGLGPVPSVGPGVCADAFPDGRVLIALSALDGSLAIRRLSPTGAPDHGFGRGGQVSLSPGPLAGVQPFGLIAAPDGSAYLAFAKTELYTDQPVSVAHLLADGRIDRAYGQDGIATTSATTGIWYPYGGCVSSPPILQPDGKLLLFDAAFPSDRLIRLQTDGREDAGLTHPVGEPVEAVLPDGRLVVIHCNTCGDPNYGGGGVAYKTPEVTSIVVLRPDGSVDPGFNGGQPLMTVPFVSFVVARSDGTIDAFGDNQARIDGHGNTIALQDIPQADRGYYNVLPQADGGYVVLSWNHGQGSLFKVDASLVRHGSARPYTGVSMGGDLWWYPSPIITHGQFTSFGALPDQWLLPRSEGFFVVGDVALYDRRANSRRDEVGVAAVDGKSRLITSYGGPARPARIRVKTTRRRPLVVDVTVPRAGTIFAQAWDRANHQRAQTLWPALSPGTVRVRLKSLRDTRRRQPVARYTVTFRDLAGINSTVNLAVTKRQSVAKGRGRTLGG